MTISPVSSPLQCPPPRHLPPPTSALLVPVGPDQLMPLSCFLPWVAPWEWGCSRSSWLGEDNVCPGQTDRAGMGGCESHAEPHVRGRQKNQARGAHFLPAASAACAAPAAPRPRRRQASRSSPGEQGGWEEEGRKAGRRTAQGQASEGRSVAWTRSQNATLEMGERAEMGREISQPRGAAGTGAAWKIQPLG